MLKLLNSLLGDIAVSALGESKQPQSSRSRGPVCCPKENTFLNQVRFAGLLEVHEAASRMSLSQPDLESIFYDSQCMETVRRAWIYSVSGLIIRILALHYVINWPVHGCSAT